MPENSEVVTTPLSKLPEMAEFVALSAKVGQDPLQIQGAGGNTSVKDGNTLWIKASGKKLAHAMHEDIFVAVDLVRARDEAYGKSGGDGSFNDAGLAASTTLRPSIETTFHAVIEKRFVFHTHSVAAICHMISDQGVEAAESKLAGLAFSTIGYRQPGLDLTQAILEASSQETQVFLLRNHGLICAADHLDEVGVLIETVERRLKLDAQSLSTIETPASQPPNGYVWRADLGRLAIDPRLTTLVTGRTFYPDHFVFLGDGLAPAPGPQMHPVVVVRGVGIAVRADASVIQLEMLSCLAEVVARISADWTCNDLPKSELEKLANWDAEKFRQALNKDD